LKDFHPFGTDGIRGRSGQWPMVPEFVWHVVRAAVLELFSQGGAKLVVVGRDTRASSLLFERVVSAAASSCGMDIWSPGVAPTAAVAFLAAHADACCGIMVSASHNSWQDNGIKFFAPGGRKLRESEEIAIVERLSHASSGSSRLFRSHGRVRDWSEGLESYKDHCLETVAGRGSLSGMRLVVDGANGAVSEIAPQIFSALGADVACVSVSPDGYNINMNCGSVHPETLIDRTLGEKVDAGLAFDGDGDRLMMTDNRGHVFDGDDMLYMLASSWHVADRLRDPVVGTVLSNMGLETALKRMGLSFERVRVGDRYVSERLAKTGGVLGGETSGHVVMPMLTPTGDGILTALQVLYHLKEIGGELAQLTETMVKYAQLMFNVPSNGKSVDVLLRDPCFRAAMEETQSKLGSVGRVVVRPSGTEPVIRVMVEAEDPELSRYHMQRLARMLIRAVE